MVGERDLDRAVVEQFGVAVAAHFVHFVATFPREEDHRWAVADIEAGLQSTKCDLAVVVVADGDRGGTAEVEIIAIPQIGLDNAPAADHLAARRRGHVGTASSFGSRTRL
ncbi:hypothetical protein Amn_pb01470 (plasmid) [Aminobacter sp. Y103A]|nr:hypothetical protein Amn_pb01470 [Aminobacter sp. SS-2016]